MGIHLEGFGPLKDYFPPEGHCYLALEGARSLRDILEELKIPLEAILALTVNGQILELDDLPRDGETIRLIPLVGGG